MKKIFTLFLCTTAMACLKAQNPVLLKDIRPGTAGSMGATGKVTEIVPTRQGYTFFNADDDGDGLAGLWRTDGTSAGTVKVNLTYPGYITYGASMITPLGANSVVFAGDNSAGYGEVWVSDGTQANTIALESYKPDSPAISAPPVMGMASTGNYVVYAVMTSNNHIQVKATNGSVAGTRVVKDFGGGKKNSMVAEMKALNGMVYYDYFDADGDGNDILLATDGVGTYRIGGTYSIPGQTQQYALASSFMPATNNPGIAGNDVYFFGYGFTDNHFKLFRINNAGVLFTISAVKDFPGRTSTGSYAAINGTLYFTIDDKLHGTELWKTDGTEAGTVLAADINVGAGSSNPRNLVVMNNTLYFTATVDINLDGQATETGIFSYDGTTAHLMAEVSPNSSDVSNIGVCSNNTLLFSLNADKGSEPWIGGGTGINAPLADINPGANGSAPTLFTPVGDAVYFVADNGANGKELMKYTVESKVWDGIFSNKWNEADNWIPSGVPSATDNVLVGGLLENPGGDALFINDLIVNGEINSPSLFFINGNFYNSGKVTVNQLITGNTDGHLLHTFGGAGTFTGDIVPQNKSTLRLATNFTVNGELRFQSGQGNVNLNDYNLLVNSVSRQTTDAHVTTNGLGMLVLSNSGTTPLFFPVGSTNTSYTPATIINKGTADRFGVRVTDSTHRNGDNGATATSSVVNKTWFVKEGKNGGSDVDLTVQWNATDELPGFNRNNVYLNHYINSAWDAGTAAPATGSGPYTITRKSITSFSPFAVSSSATVLPIGLTNFEVTAKENDALLLWTTASEKNTSHFNIQRSTDGVNFTLAGVKTAAGNSNTLTAYTYTDYLNGLTGAVYYRLQAVDKDGKTSFSQVRHIMVGDRADFSFSPNPAKNLLTVHGSNIKNIQLFNGEGKLVVEQAVNSGSVASQVNVSTLAKGVYLLVTTNYNGGKQTAKVVIE